MTPIPGPASRQASPFVSGYRSRLALSFSGFFVVSGIVLLLVVSVLWQGSTVTTVRSPGSSPLGTTHHSNLMQLLMVAGISLVIMTVATIGFGWLVAGRFLRPLRAMTATVRSISAHNLDERIRIDGPADELHDLASTFNALLDRLEQAFRFQGRFIANASHELRTPLTTMRVRLDVATAKPGPVPTELVVLADRLREELDHVDRLLESLLTLARSQHAAQDAQSDFTTVSLDALTVKLLEQQSAAIARKQLAVEHHAESEARVAGSEMLLGRMVENLVVNAIKHNADGGWLRVVVRVADRVASLTVENGGAALSQDDVDQLGQPFRRIGPDRMSGGGAGLGLSIVKSIVETYGGTLRLTARTAGGLEALVELPLADGDEAGNQT